MLSVPSVPGTVPGTVRECVCATPLRGAARSRSQSLTRLRRSGTVTVGWRARLKTHRDPGNATANRSERASLSRVSSDRGAPSWVRTHSSAENHGISAEIVGFCRQSVHGPLSIDAERKQFRALTRETRP